MTDDKVLQELLTLEAMAKIMLDKSATLRKRLEAGGQPSTARKGKKVNPMAAQAMADYTAKLARKYRGV